MNAAAATKTFSVAEAIAELKRAGFDARFQNGRVWFNAAGRSFSRPRRDHREGSARRRGSKT
jgi:hypothetical protein